MTSKRVLITGLHGFTGRYVCAEMERGGYEVFGIDRSQHSNNKRYYNVDLLDSEALLKCIADVKPHAVVHLAGIAFVGHSNTKAFYEVNLVGSLNLLDALYRCAPDVESILLASSANVYGNAVEGKLDEKTPFRPANDYAVSKAAMERMASLWFEKLPVFIVRPFNYTGVGQSESFLIPKIVKYFKDKKPVIELGNLDVWREFNDVRFVAQIYRRLIETSPVGEVFNICTGKMYSLHEVIKLAETLTGHSVEIKVNPDFIRKNEVVQLSGNCSKLKKMIGDWNTVKLKQTIEWMLGNS